MNIIEVKNNLVKLCYEDAVTLASLLLIEDTHQSYIAQVLHLESTRVGKVAIAKILFNYKDEIYAYDGSIPSLRADIKRINFDFLLNTLDRSNPLVLGKISGENANLTVDFNMLNDNPIIISEKFYLTKILLNNLAIQLQARKNKIVVFDTSGIFKNNNLTVTKNFKLPLNSSTINYIYEKGFEDATAESKALIQSIFEELGNYSKTVEFIPFDTFKSVVDAEFMRTRLMQLIVMKNKIKQIKDWNVFAQTPEEFNILRERFETEDTIVVDISCLKPSLQLEAIKYAYSVLADTDGEFYAFTPLTDDGLDTFLLNQILKTENVHTTLICDYDFKYLTELKKYSKNMFMFTPLKQQNDFGSYNTLLQKLSEDEFIAYGKVTKFTPVVGRLNPISGRDVFIPKVAEGVNVEGVNNNVEEPVKEGVNIEGVNIAAEKHDIEEAVIEDVVTAPTPEEQPADIIEPVAAEGVNEGVVNILTETPEEEPTDVIEPVAAEEVKEDGVNIVTETPEEEPADVIEPVADESEAVEADGAAEDKSADSESAGAVESADAETKETDETAATEEGEAEEDKADDTETEDGEASENDDSEEKSIDDMVSELADETAGKVVPPAAETEEVSPVEQAEAETGEAAKEEAADGGEAMKALEEAEDIVDDEELSDDDLDMIDELSKPDAEIAVLNEEPAVQDETPTDAAAEPETPSEPEAQPEQPAAVDDDIQKADMPKQAEPLQTRANTNPVVPEYSAEIPEEDKVKSDVLAEGDKVMHDEFGEGVVEKLINYGDKVLCSIDFASVGRRLLNPEISEMRKI